MSELAEPERDEPDLRFPEFDGAWEGKTIEEVVRFSNGKAHEQHIDDNGNFIVINSKYISSEGAVRKHSNRLICELSDSDIVMVMSDVPKGKALAKCMYIAKAVNFSLNQRICALSENKQCNKFLFFIINRNRYFLKFDSGVGQTNLRKQEVLDCPLRIPPLPEQQKIASFLSAVDEKIAQLEEKKNLLEDYKKGCMQQLFSQALRFKDEDGNDYPDWEEKRLGDVLEFFKGKGISKSDIVDGGQTKCIRYGEIYTLYNEKIELIYSTTNAPIEALFLSKKGDVIIPSSGEDRLDMARACCVTESSIALGGDINVLRGQENGIFLAYYLNNAKKKEIAKYAQGISVIHLYGSQLISLKVSLPHPDEQQKIADFLSALDDKITHATTQLEQTKSFKKGLLQKMFV